MIQRKINGGLVTNTYLKRLEERLYHTKNEETNYNNPFYYDSFPNQNQIKLKQINDSYSKKFAPFNEEQNHLIDYNNKKLLDRLNDINLRKNNFIYKNDHLALIDTRNKFFNCIRNLKQKQLNEENQNIKIRRERSSGFINRVKMEKDYLENRKLFYQIRKIKPINRTSFYQMKYNYQKLVNNVIKTRNSKTRQNLNRVNYFTPNKEVEKNNSTREFLPYFY